MEHKNQKIMEDQKYRNVRIPEDLYHRLRDEKKNTGKTIQFMVDEALEIYLMPKIMPKDFDK